MKRILMWSAALTALTPLACGSADDDPFTSSAGGSGGMAGASTGGSSGSGGASGSSGSAGMAGRAGSSGSSGAGGSSGSGGAAGAGGGPCGDGTLDIGAGEQCDDGGVMPGDGCDANCQFEPVGMSCGDGTKDQGEVCDDMNRANGDGCNPTCNFTNTTTLFAGSPGQPGNVDGIGMQARLSGYGALAAGQSAIWFGDGGSRSVRRVDVATAEVKTVAGDGQQGYQDDPDGSKARFSDLGSIATDGTSTVWVTDGGNRRVRAISMTPPYAVTTLSGAGTQGAGDGSATTAEFDDPRGLTYYSGYLYLVDGNAAVLRRIDPANGDVVTLAGAPYQQGNTDGAGAAARFQSPRYMASDNKGTLYIADTNGATIRTYDVATNTVGTFAGTGTAGYADGPSSSALVHRPRGITHDGTSVYWAEFNQHTLRQGVMATGQISTMLGKHCGGMQNCSGGYVEGVGTQAELDGPFAVAYHYPSRSLFLLDANAVIRRVQ